MSATDAAIKKGRKGGKADRVEGVADIPLQETSLDIWDKKYRLKTKEGEPVDADVDGTFARVARALADVETSDELRERWHGEFLWALRQGAIPAGRITSNAGALAHKPATSTINCTVSGTIVDSMDDILSKVHEAGLTLKAGCVAPGTTVVTEHGHVPVERAVAERHERILSYDKATTRFEMRRVEKHMTTTVEREDNLEIRSNGTRLLTSCRHPVLVYRQGKTRYVRADEVGEGDAMIHRTLAWRADEKGADNAWFAGAHLGDGSACEKKFDRSDARGSWRAKAEAAGKRLVFRIRAAEREVVERYAAFFRDTFGSRARVVATGTPNGTAAWDFQIASFAASEAADLFDRQIGEKSSRIHVPAWILREPDRHFLPFLAGLLDTDGTVSEERGAAILSTRSERLAEEIRSTLALFGVNVGITRRKARSRELNGQTIRDAGGHAIEIGDSDFLGQVARFMADSGKKRRIREFAGEAGQHDRYVMPESLKSALEACCETVGHRERQTLGFHHGYHRAELISRVWLDRWRTRFPELGEAIDFCRTLRPVEGVRRGLDLPTTFYDFTVEENNNYLAGVDGLVVIHNCGIGYDFSTLRPRGAYVSGAGAYTSGPLSFMDIFDKMCFTVSSAGGRRGAQMGTFDVRHPDVLEYVKAKREDGRLRQFNLSLLITEDFIQAVKADEQWQLAFPIRDKEMEEGGISLDDPDQIVWRDWPSHENVVANDEGLVACRIYRTMPARRLWDLIMASTYDFAEPGFILIDKVNEMNNNWFEESIRATNPCVTGDTWVHTSEGPRQVDELIGTRFEARVDGVDHASDKAGFFKTATKEVVQLETREGHSITLTSDHRVRRVTRFDGEMTRTQWCPAGELQPGERVLLNDHRDAPTWQGKGTANEGYLLGLLIGEGTIKRDAAVLSAWAPARAVNEKVCIAQQSETGSGGIAAAALIATTDMPKRSDFRGWFDVARTDPATGQRMVSERRMKPAALTKLAREFGLAPGHETITPEIERTSSEFHASFLRGLFDADGSVQGVRNKSALNVRLAQSDLSALRATQRMLLRLGIASTIYRERRKAARKQLPNGRGGTSLYSTEDQHELVIVGENIARFAETVGFEDERKRSDLAGALAFRMKARKSERFTAVVLSVTAAGVEDVYDVQIPGINTFDGSGLHVHNCGEQPLPPYGACLLGSINLTRFVDKPFTDDARFDWERFERTVAVFTRMLDNVVEINGLPLKQQRKEIERKRRHGMGYLGLGSTLTLLGMSYGDEKSLAFTEEVTKRLALAGWRAGLELAKEKGPAPIMDETFTVTGEMLRKRPEMKADGVQVGDELPGRVLHAKYSRYMQRVAEADPELVAELAEVGSRFTHHSSIAPTGTISLSLANNASNGIEPSFAHLYSRNVIREGKKSKEKVDVLSFELLAYRELVDADAAPFADDPAKALPPAFVSADDIRPVDHVAVQAAAQKWIDSSISKTANVPTDFPFDDFKDIYMTAYEQGLKGCTTFRFNPENFQGVLVKEEDLENTEYAFTLDDGSEVRVKGNEQIEYDGETHTAANLYDALKEGYYGKF